MAFIIYGRACYNSSQATKIEYKMEKQEINMAFPTAEKWVKSPLRNRIKLELNAPIDEVWAVVGDPAKVLIYSSDLSKVETKTDDSGTPTEYTLFYKPCEETGAEETVHSKVLWYEANKGWAALDEEPNGYGLQQSLLLITVEQQNNKTIINWNMHYDSESNEALQMLTTSLEQLLKSEIAEQLIKTFGGSIL